MNWKCKKKKRKFKKLNIKKQISDGAIKFDHMFLINHVLKT